jgi:predicted carbohydrate-binding protein with CBM48
MSDSRLWREIERDLRRIPVTEETAGVDRVMDAVRDAAQESPLAWAADEADLAPRPLRFPRLSGILDWLTRRTIVLAPAHLLAVFVVVAGSVAILTRSARFTGSTDEAPAPVAAVATVVSSEAGVDGTHEVRFLFVSDSARRVSVAGDFNDWNRTATPLRRAGNGNVWSVVVRVQPGRHLYAFVVNDSTWVSDATAPRAPETEFGGESSVLFVSRKS